MSDLMIAGLCVGSFAVGILTALKARLRTAEEDKKTVDWLEKHAFPKWRREDDDNVACVTLTICAEVGVSELPKPLRTAIDAARQSAPTEDKP